MVVCLADEYWEVTDKRIYQLLKHPYQVDKSVVENMTAAYLDFVEELLAYLNEEKNNKDIIRKLDATQIEFVTCSVLLRIIG